MRRRAALAALLLLAGTAIARDLPDRRLIEEARDEVLARPEFHKVAQGGESAVLSAAAAFVKFVARFADEHPVAFTCVMILLVLTLLLLVAHIVWTIVVSRRARYLPEPELPALDVRRTPPDTFRDRAIRLAEEGRFEEAVRDLYAALILTLDRRGDVTYARHKALLDYRLEARADDARAALEAMAGGYHPTSFGRRPLPAERFRALLALLDEVRT